MLEATLEEIANGALPVAFRRHSKPKAEEVSNGTLKPRPQTLY